MEIKNVLFDDVGVLRVVIVRVKFFVKFVIKLVVLVKNVEFKLILDSNKFLVNLNEFFLGL